MNTRINKCEDIVQYPLSSVVAKRGAQRVSGRIGAFSKSNYKKKIYETRNRFAHSTVMSCRIRVRVHLHPFLIKNILKSKYIKTSCD